MGLVSISLNWLPRIVSEICSNKWSKDFVIKKKCYMLDNKMCIHCVYK